MVATTRYEAKVIENEVRRALIAIEAGKFDTVEWSPVVGRFVQAAARRATAA